MGVSSVKILKRERAKNELAITLITTLRNFKSKEEPDVELTNMDMLNVLAGIIKTETNKLP